VQGILLSFTPTLWSTPKQGFSGRGNDQNTDQTSCLPSQWLGVKAKRVKSLELIGAVVES
jgi:hypothetical protein